MKLVNYLFLKSGKYYTAFCISLAALCLFATMPAHAATANTLEMPHDIITRLADSDRTTRATAAFELRLYGQSALPLLIEAYDSIDTIQRRGAIVGIALLPQPATGMSTLVNALSDMDMGTRSMAAHGLAVIGQPAAKELTKILMGSNLQAREAAAFGLKMLGKKAVTALTEAVKNGDEYTRSKAAWLLGRMGKDALSAVPSLIDALDAKDERVMHVVAEAIDLIGPAPALASYHLIQLDNTRVGCPATRIGAQAAPTLVRLLSRPGTPLAQTAFRTLATIGNGAKPALKSAIASGSQGQRIAAALLLVEIDPDEVFTLPEDVRNTLASVPRKPKQ